MKNKHFETSILQVVFCIILIFLAIIQPFRQLSDPDMFWHIETGNYILSNHVIPTTDVFSYYGIDNNLPWIAHEWLSDIIFAIIYNIGGYSLIRFFPIVMLLTMYLYINKKTKLSDNQIEKYLMFFLPFLMISSLSEVRAHMFSWFFTAITIFTLLDFYDDKNNRLFLLPVISCLWVNMHGGSSALLYVLIAIFIIASFFQFDFGKISSKKQGKEKIIKLIIILGISLLTALINPNTYKMLLYPIQNMQDDLMLSVIVEWHSPNFHTFDGLVIFILLAMMVSILVSTKKQIRFIDFLLLGAFTYLSLKSIRQVVYLAIITIPLLLNYLPNKLKISNMKNMLNTIIIVFMLIFSIFYVFTETQKPIIEENVFPSKTAMQKIEEIKPQRMLNNYDWGGYFIKTLNKDIKPFIDGRADVYSKYTLADFTRMMYLSNGWENILDKYNFDCIVMTTDSIFTREVSKLPEWKIEYSDELTTILIKEESLK